MLKFSIEKNKGKLMIYDCFSFFNELNILEVRLNILNDVVDKFVLIEATKTHANKEKPLYFQENKERFKKFEDKISHVIVDEYPEFESAWSYENNQRTYLSTALKDCKDDDTIIISDLDEIPNPAKVLEYKDTPGMKAFKQHFFYYFFNNLSNEVWLYAKMLSYKEFKHILDDFNQYSECLIEQLNQGTTATKIRHYLGEKKTIIEDGGWHFSYLADFETLSYKIKSFGHQEFNSKKYTDVKNIEERIKAGKDIYEREGYNFQSVKITAKEFPQYLVENMEKYGKYILPDTKCTIHEYLESTRKKQKRRKLLAKCICWFVPVRSWRDKIKDALL